MLSIEIRWLPSLGCKQYYQSKKSESKNTEQAITDEIRSLGPGKEIKILFRFVILFMGDQNEKIKKFPIPYDRKTYYCIAHMIVIQVIETIKLRNLQNSFKYN